MQNRLIKLIALIAAVQMLGGQWVVLQTVAWVGMIVKYSEQGTLVGAVEKTFDGDHPCALCKVVKAGRDEDQKREMVTSIVKIEAVLSILAQLPPPPPSCRHFQPPLFTLAETFVPVPTRPPRVA